MKILITLIIVGQLILTSTFIIASGEQKSTPATMTFNDVLMTESDAAFLTGHDTTWRPTTLPFQINNDSVEDQAQYYWFKHIFIQQDSSRKLALYFPKFQFDLQVYFNGNHVGGTHAPLGKQATGWHQPLVIYLRESDWNAGNNEILLRLSSGIPTTLLHQFYLGDAETFRSTWEYHKLFSKQFALISIVVSIVASMISMFIWNYRRAEREYLVFAIFTAAWVLPLSTRYFSYAPFSNEYYFKLATICVDLSALLLFILANLGLKLRLSGLAKLLMILTAFNSCFILLSPSSFILKAIPAIFLIKILALCFTFIFYLKNIREFQNHRIWILSALGLVIITLSIDILNHTQGSFGKSVYHTETYTRYLIPVYVVIFLAFLINKFLKSLADSEYLNKHLEEKVAQNKQELEKSYIEKREYEIREAENLEKQRIYKDLHDDVGSKLVSILHSEDEEASKGLAKSALEYLRESASQVKNTSSTLSKIIEQIFEETQIRCTTAHIEPETNLIVKNQVLLERSIPNLGYHLSRIIREGLTNSIKHSDATKVFLDINVQENQIEILLKDNGSQFKEVLDRGTGTSNMRYRAEEIGADISWSQNEFGGCDLSLVLYQ